MVKINFPRVVIGVVVQFECSVVDDSSAGQTRPGSNAEPFRGPTHPRPLPGGEQAFIPVVPVPLLGGVRGGFRVQMHGIKVAGLFTMRIFYFSAIFCRSGCFSDAGADGVAASPSSMP